MVHRRDGSKWEHHFLRCALIASEMSKDPRTRVGALITTRDGVPVSDGFNGFPRGIADTPERLLDRKIKNVLMVHAEMNAIINAARLGASTIGTILYIACNDDTGEVWGGAPCASECIKHILQAGFLKVVCYPAKTPSTWSCEIAQSIKLMDEAELPLIVINKPTGLTHFRPRHYDNNDSTSVSIPITG